jgi:hypothetical protein
MKILHEGGHLPALVQLGLQYHLEIPPYPSRVKT